MDAMTKIEETFWKLGLIKQAVRGIAHRGTKGDIGSVEDEALPVEDAIDGVRAELESIVAALCNKEAAA